MNWRELLKEIEVSGIELNESDLDIADIDLRYFEESRGWHIIKSLLISHLEHLRDTLEVMGKGYEREDIAHTQGEIYRIRMFLDMPEILRQRMKEHEQEQSGEERT